MTYKEKQIYELVLKYINKSKRTYLELNKIYEEVNDTNQNVFRYIHSSEGYLKFHNVIKKLCDEEVIEPTKSSNSNGMNPSLKCKYKISKVYSDNKEVVLELMRLNSKISIDKFYLMNPKSYIKDRKVIEVINEFLNNPSNFTLTIHERSWQMFGDEKFLRHPGKKSQGEIILGNLGLTFEDLNCQHAYEPFIYFKKSEFSEKESRRLLVIENKDTFWSFQNIIFEQNNTLDIDMLIFGEGNKIVSSFQYAEKLEVNGSDDVLYFGDIDREGLNIFNRFRLKYGNYNIKYFVEMYEYLLDSINDSAPDAKNKQVLNNDAVEIFIESMDNKYSRQIQEIIFNNKYIPQEVMNYEVLFRLYIRSNM